MRLYPFFQEHGEKIMEWLGAFFLPFFIIIILN